MSSPKTVKSSISDPASALDVLVAEIRACRFCAESPAGVVLPHEPRPVFHPSATARIVLASQAPGIRVHNSGLPFNDASGDRLRDWLGLDRETFYDRSRVAIAPMGFCFPGWDANKGDLPPRRECRTLWHDRLFAAMPQIELVLAIGSYAQDYHFARLGLPPRGKRGMGEIVRDWQAHLAHRPAVLALPHPSWRNSGWLKRNPWFEAELIPQLRERVADLVR